MKKSAALIITILFSLILLNCGEEDSSTKDESPTTFYYGAKVVASTSALPICDAETEGQMYYIQDIGEFQYCNGGSYTVIDTTGPQGAPGEDGYNSVLLVSNENPGVNCTYGGKKIEVGLDTNDNGALDPGEINHSATSYVCYQETFNVFYGSVNIDSTDDITAIAGYDIISGNLTIQSDTLTNIDGLSGISIVTGELNIISNTVLENTNGLSGLERSGNVTVTGNANLISLNLSSLDNVDIEIRIENNTILPTMDLSSVTAPKQIWIINNPTLSAITLPNLESVEFLEINSNNQLGSITCNSLIEAGDISIYNHTDLTSISFSLLETVSGGILIGQDSTVPLSSGNQSLGTITLNALTSTGALAIGDNDLLTTITMNMLDTIDWYLSIHNNDILTTIDTINLCNVSTGNGNDAYKQFNIHDNSSLCQTDVDSLKVQVEGCGGMNWLSEDISNNKACP